MDFMGISMDMQRIDTEHKITIERIRGRYGHTLSSHAFVSLYLWQNVMKLSLLCDDDFYTVRCGMYEDNLWFFPCGDEKKIYDFLREHMEDKAFSLCYLRECDVKWLDRNFPDRWLFKRTENSDEYICDIAEYLSLEGSKFSEIRRKIRKIDKSYDIKVCKISDGTSADAMSVVSKWHEIQHHTDENGLTDDMIAECALNERARLNISGIVLYADNQPVSVFAGFPLSGNTVDVLIGKCIPDAPKGIAYYALREYLRLCGEGYTYCNHEEDLGIDGIRQMKNSLCPIEKTPIWRAVRK